MRINICPACNAQKNGVKSRIAFEHTCGNNIQHKPRSYARFFAILKQVNANGLELTKEQAVLDFTAQRTDSLSSLSPTELAAMEASLSSMIAQRQLNIPRVDLIADTMRKAIISQFLSIGKTVDDAKAWAEKYGVNGEKRRFNDYDNQQLWLLVQNAKKMKKDHIKALNK